MQINKITALIDKSDAKLAVLLCHHNADPDAVCAAFAFSQLLKRLRPKLKVTISSLPIKLAAQPHIEQADLVVLLDTNTIQQLDEWSEQLKTSNSPLVVIDHHASHPDTEHLATVSLTDEKASSTCEIVYQLFREAEVKPTKVEAKALFLGIAFDTRHFILASSATFKTVADLIDAGLNVEETLPLLSLPIDLSERIARLTLSQVSAYQASAARALIRLGAHMAVVVGQRGDKLQVSLRACRDFYEKTGIHLGRDVAKPLGDYLHGMGGGHSTSAGANGVGEVDLALKRCVRILREKLKRNICTNSLSFLKSKPESNDKAT